MKYILKWFRKKPCYDDLRTVGRKMRRRKPVSHEEMCNANLKMMGVF